MHQDQEDERRTLGRKVMAEVLGAPYCERRDASTNDFNAPIRRLKGFLRDKKML